jgi:hypothetical protein
MRAQQTLKHHWASSLFSFLFFFLGSIHRNKQNKKFQAEVLKSAAHTFHKSAPSKFLLKIIF